MKLIHRGSQEKRKGRDGRREDKTRKGKLKAKQSWESADPESPSA